MGSTTQQQKEWITFQQNLKKTAFGIKFGKRLFTNPEKFTAKDLVTICRYLGLDVPKEMQLTADLVQIWASGAAAVEVIEGIRSGVDYKDAIKPNALAVRLGTNFAEDKGYIDANSASMLRTGVHAACIYASGGADVSAWIGAATELGGQSEIVKAEVKIRAMTNAMRVMQDTYQQQKNSIAESIKDLQAGRIGVFGFLLNLSSKGGLLFENAINNPAFATLKEKLPGLNFLPYGDWQFRGSASGSTWYGDTKSDDYQISVRGLAQFPQEKAFDLFFGYVVEPFGYAYLESDAYYQKMGKASIFDAAILALFDPRFEIKNNYSVLDSLLKAQLTPKLLGIDNTFANYVEKKASAFTAISSNFGMSAQRKSLTKEEMYKLDASGDISALSQVRESQEILVDKFSYPQAPVELYVQNFTWRKYSNFLAVLDAMDIIYSDPMYEKWRNKSDRLKAYEIFPRIQNFKAQYEYLNQVSMIKKVNQLALGNIAYFMGTNNIELKNPGNTGAAVYGVKRG